MAAEGEKKKSRTPGRTSRTVLLTDQLIERARNAVYWCRVIPGEPASFAALAERGLTAEVERLEREHNEGNPFPHGELRPGPAPGVMERVSQLRREAQANAQSEPDKKG